MTFKTMLIFLTLLSVSCNNEASSGMKKNATEKTSVPDSNPYQTIAAIPLPEGFERVTADSNSFAAWLRAIHLKENKTVHLYDGSLKKNQLAQFAVIDISVGDKNLQQCADAVMRLRSEYLFDQKKFTEIIFNDNNKISYVFEPPYSRAHFNNYLQQVFGMCGSASLAKQLKSVTDFSAIIPGDVLIRGGFPGHAEIVMDVAANKKGEKIFMLAQSYMPAQDIHIVINPVKNEPTPWYAANESTENILTPEYQFYKSELKRW
jgi:hypothetical protein